MMDHHLPRFVQFLCSCCAGCCEYRVAYCLSNKSYLVLFFCQMLRTGKTSFSSGPAWGRRLPSQPLTNSLLTSSSSRQRTGSDSEPEPEGYVPAPTFSQSFSDAIAVALAKSEKSASEASVGGGGKKKKKQKPKVLFSTSMACSGK